MLPDPKLKPAPKPLPPIPPLSENGCCGALGRTAGVDVDNVRGLADAVWKPPNDPEDEGAVLLPPNENGSGDDEAVVLVADVAEAELLEPNIGIPAEEPAEDGVMPNEKGEEDITPVAAADVVVDVDDRAVVPDSSLKPPSDVVVDVDDRAVVPEPSLKPLASPGDDDDDDDATELPALNGN